MPIKQSFCSPCFTNDQVDFNRICQAAAQIGYSAVEWWARNEAFTDQVAIAKQYGLSVASMCGHQSLTAGLNDPAEHDSIVAELTESIRLAVEHGIPNLICFSGNRREGQTDAQAIEACASCLTRVIPAAEKAGVTLNMELLNSKVDHPGYQADHTAWGVAVCQRVCSPNFKLLYDIYHMQIMEGDVIRTIQDNISWIGHLHTAGNPGRRDLDQTQELYFPAICHAIHASGFGGYIAHEFRPKSDPIMALKAAFEQCKSD